MAVTERYDGLIEYLEKKIAALEDAITRFKNDPYEPRDRVYELERTLTMYKYELNEAANNRLGVFENYDAQYKVLDYLRSSIDKTL